MIKLAVKRAFYWTVFLVGLAVVAYGISGIEMVKSLFR
jgi:hypothetical protein